MKHCDDIRSRVAFYLDDELRGDELAGFEGHLKTCEACGKDMMRAKGCTAELIEYEKPAPEPNKIDLPDRPYRARIPYGAERRNGMIDRELLLNQSVVDRCHDCNAALGRLHHYGCDMEECPLCGLQLISCGCPAVALASATPLTINTGNSHPRVA